MVKAHSLLCWCILVSTLVVGGLAIGVTPAAAQECECSCLESGTDPYIWHTCDMGPYLDVTGPWHDHLVFGKCTSHGHVLCGGTVLALEFMDELVDDLKGARDIIQIEAILERFGDQAVLNRKRATIQVTGCEGTVIANIPVDSLLAQGTPHGPLGAANR